MLCFLLFVPVIFAQNAIDPRQALENVVRTPVRSQRLTASTPVMVTPTSPCSVPLLNATPPAADATKIRVLPPPATSNMPIVTVPAPPCPAK